MTIQYKTKIAKIYMCICVYIHIYTHTHTQILGIFTHRLKIRMRLSSVEQYSENNYSGHETKQHKILR